MCRLLGYLGPQIELDELLYGFEHPFVRQSHAPRYQDVGRINADGWGVGWWDLAHRSAPARYRTVTPMWADNRFRDMAPLLRSTCVVAAMRNASPGAPIDETGNAPFLSGRVLFAHNGFVDRFRDDVGVQLRRSVSERHEREILGAADTEVLFAMVLDRLDEGATASDALAGVITTVCELTTGRFNFLFGDGETLTASRWGNSLFTLTDHHNGGVAHLVASEPLYDDERWNEVPDQSVVTITPDGISTNRL